MAEAALTLRRTWGWGGSTVPIGWPCKHVASHELFGCRSTMQGLLHTLLIGDDEAEVLESLRQLFQRTYRVLTAHGGDQAVKTLGSDDVHVILADERMPGMGGIELMNHARRLRPDAIRLLVTG